MLRFMIDLDLERDGDVFVIRMNAGENRFTPAMVEASGEAHGPVLEALALPVGA